MNFDLIPADLRQFVVQQDYSEYTAEDQAVWRFAVLNTHRRLLAIAHAAYAHGFSAAGISVETIPQISRMSRSLERFGWRAVAVDGFIPPRVFTAFQARGILPIAADIRTSEHLTYTPAPDIIHEAAGHAPFLADPHYARYVRRVGETAELAFATPADHEVYEAAYTLSEVKENPASTTQQLAHAERLLEKAARAQGEPSDAARIARLYWWTAEYGLVGRVTDYKLYGAGLLSSIGEAHFCHSPSVSKLPLTAACVDVGYDITRSQPQLFVVPSLAELEPVLESVADTLAYRRGGDDAIEAARLSADVAAVELDSGAQLVGVVSSTERHEGELSLVLFSGQCAVAAHGAVVAGLPRAPAGYALPLGVLESGMPLSRIDPALLARCTDGAGRFELRLRSGIRINGRLQRLVRVGTEILVLVAENFALEQQGRPLFHAAQAYPCVLGHRVRTAGAAIPAGYFPETAVSATTVPKPRTYDEAQRQRIGLHERGLAAWRSLAGSDLVREFEAIAARLDRAYPDEWLLRWNLLESLVKLGERSGLTERLERDLELLEVRFEHLEPIASGLGYIRSLVAGGERTRERQEAPR